LIYARKKRFIVSSNSFFYPWFFNQQRLPNPGPYLTFLHEMAFASLWNRVMRRDNQTGSNFNLLVVQNQLSGAQREQEHVMEVKR
jgi:hypothetical protein